MGVSNERFRHGDVFVQNYFEEVMFRYEFSTRRFFRKFYGESKEDVFGVHGHLHTFREGLHRHYVTEGVSQVATTLPRREEGPRLLLSPGH